MQVELNSDVALSAANALVSHLRRNPEAAFQSPRDLAATFGLDESFVAQVLQGINANRRAEPRSVSVRPSGARSLSESTKRLWMRATDRPLIFIGLTLVISFALLILVNTFMPDLGGAAERGIVGSSGFSPTALAKVLSTLGIIGLTFMLHMAVYFRHRSGRQALYGGLILFVALLIALGATFFSGNPPKTTPGTQDPGPVVLYLLGSMLMLFMALMYSGVGALAAVLGGWTRLKLLDRAEETMSRQDLLERYFELQSRLQKSAYPRPAGQGPAIFSAPFVIWYRKNQLLCNIVLGFLLSSLSLVCVAAGGMTPGAQQNQISVWFFVVMLVGVIDFLLYIIQGYLAKSVWMAILGALCISGGSLLSRLLPLKDMPGANFGVTGLLLIEAVDILVKAGIASAAYLGAYVQVRATREANLQRNDQATLLAEMVRIQWKLSNEIASVCVMVVDAAKSSEMKADADPLAVEYVFREYQEWIEAISVKRSGEVHSTAGDGAVVAFDTCGLALSAARRIQSDVFQFNKDVNRLSRPFRLRIGLHTGEVAGDIREVQFTEVIDIAAHIESACPIGGIAVTDDVKHRLPEEQFIDLNKQVDGHEVFLVANPTEYV
jgi:class 3 adenylate cyclase